MEDFARWCDVIAAATFGIAMLLLVMAPAEPEGTFTRAVKWTLIGAGGVFLYLTGMDAAGLTEVGVAGDLFEDYLQTLEPVLALGAVFALYSAQVLRDADRAHRALVRSHELTMDIVDEAPVGILMLDPAGRVVFANEASKEMLDLEEDPSDGVLRGPGWRMTDTSHVGPNALAGLVEEGPYTGRRVRLEWPNGWFLEMTANGRPMRDSQGRLGGVIVAFAKA